MGSIDLSFVILTWNSRKFLNACFDTVIGSCEEQGIDYEILISDNGSTDLSHDIFDHYSKKLGDKFQVTYLGENKGTTYPRNIAIKKARGKYICVLDSDTEIRQGNYRDLFKLFDNDSSLGMVTPQLLLPDGSIQHSAKKFPTFVLKLKKILKAVGNLKINDNDFYEDFPFYSPRTIDTAISACWFFPKTLTSHIGYLDERIFYAPEDLDYCVRVRKGGMKILYWPDFKVLHNTQQISHRKPFSKVSRSHFYGLIYYFKKHGGWLSNNHLKVNNN